MKIAVVLARHRRLLALCGLSLLLHTLVLEWIARADRPAQQAVAAPAPLALRLAPAAAPPSHDPLRAEPQAPEQPIERAPLPAPRSIARTAAAAPPMPVEDPPAQALPAVGEPGAALVRMPGRYRVSLPPAALLSYSLVRSHRGGREQAAGSAQIVWQTSGDRYRMRTDGVPGMLTSEGTNSDAGIAPAAASEQHADGTLATTAFDTANQRITFSATQRSYPLVEGGQDRASVLMQLAGMGLAAPEQVRDTIDILIGTGEDARIARYRVLGQETIATGLGRLASWHLVQLAPPGERRLEVWLSPERSWYPVQLRATDPDGSVTTQVLSSIGEAPPLP